MVADELAEGFRLNLSLIKGMTGSDALTINPKGLPPYEPKTTATVVISTNETPQIPPGEAATWARLYSVPLDDARPIPEEAADKFFAERAAQDPAFLRAVLAWLVEGARRVLQSDGRIAIPAAAKSARQRMQRESSVLDEMLAAGVLVLDPDTVTSTPTIMRRVTDYRRETGRGNRLPSPKRIATDLKVLGCENDGGTLRISEDGKRPAAWRGIADGERAEADAAAKAAQRSGEPPAL